jgi:hypothetical protein
VVPTATRLPGRAVAWLAGCAAIPRASPSSAYLTASFAPANRQPSAPHLMGRACRGVERQPGGAQPCCPPCTRARGGLACGRPAESGRRLEGPGAGDRPPAPRLRAGLARRPVGVGGQRQQSAARTRCRQRQREPARHVRRPARFVEPTSADRLQGGLRALCRWQARRHGSGCSDRPRQHRREAWGRPVGVAIDRHGALLVADDVGKGVWRVTRQP